MERDLPLRRVRSRSRKAQRNLPRKTQLPTSLLRSPKRNRNRRRRKTDQKVKTPLMEKKDLKNQRIPRRVIRRRRKRPESANPILRRRRNRAKAKSKARLTAREVVENLIPVWKKLWRRRQLNYKYLMWTFVFLSTEQHPAVYSCVVIAKI